MTAINSNRAIRGPITAVPVVAGKGVRLVADTENNRWVVEADETVLWENTNGVSGSSFPLTLSESPANFERVRYEFRPWSSNKTIQEKAGSETSIQLDAAWVSTASSMAYSFALILSVSGTSLSFVRNIFYQWGTSSINTSDTSQFRLFKVTGVHRIANN